jgi:hypothetical protein
VEAKEQRNVEAKKRRSVKAKKQPQCRSEEIISVEAVSKRRSSAAVKQNKALKENMSTLVRLRILLLEAELFQKSLHKRIQEYQNSKRMSSYSKE